MILNQISYLDCIAFLVFLAPQLLIQVGLIETILCALQALPYLVLQMPYQFIHERYFTPFASRSPFVQIARPFQDIVIRCVRYAFARIPATIGKVFFSKSVALPFFTFRKLRHGIVRTPIPWTEISFDAPSTEDSVAGKPIRVNGLWMITDQNRRPDVVIYYAHGGGFSMGSSYFYLEFLLAWVSILKESGYSNPALFALEYTLVPEATFPKQLHEARAGYEYVLSKVDDPSRIVVSGDSAGATLILSLLLSLTEKVEKSVSGLGKQMPLPGLAILISPWAVVLSRKNRDTPSDYLNADSLHMYGSQYIGARGHNHDDLVSPGTCVDVEKWKKAAPRNGWMFVYGAEEVFAPATRELAATLKQSPEMKVEVHEEKRWIHAWPVVKLFLCNGQKERQSGLRSMTKFIRKRLP